MSDELDQLTDAEPVKDPGLPAHQHRPTDVDPAQELRAERQITGMFTLASLLLIGFCVAYVAIDKDQTFLGWSAMNFTLGATLGGALLLMGVGIIQWAKKLMGDDEMVELRHPAASTAEDRAATLEDLNAGINESGFGRRPLIRRSLFLSMSFLALPTVIMLRDMGPLPYGHKNTVWKKGMRVVNDVAGTPIKPSDLQVGQLVNAEPAIMYEKDKDGEAVLHGTELLQEKSKAAVIVVRMKPEAITPAKGRENWGIDGILCYSKICTHVGCPISLWEQQTHHLLCPCHQSTFDLADNGKVVFGPAHRPLPQLPLALDSEGYLIAVSDFPEVVGPSYPELARDQKRLDDKS
ncbi:ubiquinol-cytochrome C reductase [Aeromicrobium sp. Root344]|uniref:cytochrome bc1 complex Rieske iron-sulfur subunit n=1 Tax=Aeromicrobium sp. Root344 TaxID=1736521 RepID=UPI0006FDCD4E|nr:Rieske 2Fe-2S domain-containing protein [Aeromicrobium sp. Root344]KQV76225.1 ubiquinol-cytochrome C reductase [Aeromicrobium sp. Root344]